MVAGRRSIWCWVGLLALVGGCGDADPRPIESAPPAPVTPAEAPSTAVPDTDPSTISWTGCDISKKAYMSEAVTAYRDATGIEVVVSGGGATRGIRATAGGMSDIGGTCRHCLPEQFPEKEGGVVLTHVAWDALVFFTHPTNPQKGITQQQAKDILLGKITDWRELGGAEARILPAFRQQTRQGKLSGVGYMTRLLLFGDPTVDYRDDALFHRSSGPIEEFVETTEFSFAVTGVSSARKRSVRVLELDGVAPDKSEIASGRYPLFRPLYLVTHGEPQGAAKDFIDWVVGPAGQKVLSDAGTVNLAEGAALSERFAHWPERTDGSLIRNR